MSTTLHILVDHHNVGGWWLVLNYMRTPPTHYSLEPRGGEQHVWKFTLNNPLIFIFIFSNLGIKLKWDCLKLENCAIGWVGEVGFKVGALVGTY